ncbi:MAG: 1-deoxy-D-xylulose-5-phosphate synthase [Acidimicrobiia bacterium]|nr:1-deoxy-D-xylulose-5-phosphate synthase [Acidimicrobiia bacterium]MXZ78724.1 1-deoxy-D-xylulose-5-phosphate synthase [Acidimicrobiia bacterium]MYB74487.1 1-deoxy-D-xylulose-5-phosphate synthase [Acidimicrobiia bacterium]MYE72926.1 1-deoxy-D-xylulose-5-phosphate synthase [Acidimicrobiia bacterium]MYH97648.1 1-deoxy-D-xylulose-5-phosphate synthase [Acidimicrobiia bacterium]
MDTNHLQKITCPADLRRLGDEELTELAEEIREFIVETVNANGGHLGSNLGVVELTLALHLVFDSPRDIILWDTGHQAYVHKMLTGRTDLFETLRKPGGLSGYPSREESPHDWIENSHASTVLSYAHGLATAQEAAGGEQRRVIAVVGDGSLTGGVAFEGLNNIGHSGCNVTMVLNDNGRSYAPTISRLSESLLRVRMDPRYVRTDNQIRKVLKDIPWVGDLAGRALGATKAAVREMVEPRTFFDELGINYFGPFDGHDLGKLERVFSRVSHLEGPCLVHVLTQKGRGYAPAENDPVKNMHDMSKAKPGSYTEAFTEAMIKEAEARPEMVAITAAMPDSTGLLPFAERFPERCFDVGIAEQHAVTAAAGMAMGGLRPVVAIYSTFLTRAIDQVNLDVGLHGQPVVFCLDRAGITGDDGPSHHGVLDMVLLTKIPGMTVLAPSSYQEIQQMLHDALEITTGPVAMRWSKTAAPSVPEDEVGHGLKGRKVKEGSDVCLLAVGKMLANAQEAADLLEADGISTTVWDVRCVKPLDEDMLAHAAGHRVVVTMEDGWREGGAGSCVAERLLLAERGGPVPVIRVLGVPNEYIPQGVPDQILADCGLDPAGIAETARQALALKV